MVRSFGGGKTTNKIIFLPKLNTPNWVSDRNVGVKPRHLRLLVYMVREEIGRSEKIMLLYLHKSRSLLGHGPFNKFT